MTVGPTRPERIRALTATIGSIVAISAVVGVAPAAWAARATGPAATSATPAVAVDAGTFGALPPVRLLDTRFGNGAPTAAIGPGRTVTLQVSGRGGVPSGAGSAVLNVTVLAGAAGGTVSVYPADLTSVPTISNLNFLANQIVPNLVISQLSPSGAVKLTNSSVGRIELIADVSGYFLRGAPADAGGFGSVAPSRLLDTRFGNGAPKAAIPAGHSVNLTVAGRGGVPSSGVGAVAVNVTVTAPTAGGVITVYPTGSTRPATSNLNFLAHETVPNLVIVPVSADGRITLYNGSVGSVQLIADVAGYFRSGAPIAAGALGSLNPDRLLDTRSGFGATKVALASGHTLDLQVSGRNGVPASGAAAAVVNVTVTAPTGAGYVTVYPTGQARPTASNLNFSRNETVPNLVVAPLGTSGRITLFNGSTGTVQLIADVSGYLLSTALPLPGTSTSRYVRNISGVAGDVTTMDAEGCTDATANSGDSAYLTLLDIGAQTITAPLSAGSPGVLLTDTQVRITYAELVQAITGYLDGYARCQDPGAIATVAVGTNSDGDFGTYTASAKGTDWATDVIAPLQSAVSNPNLVVAGADDVEAGFAATASQAEQWEASYLAGGSAKLILDGAADGCPTTPGTVNAKCQPVPVDGSPTETQTWTQTDYATIYRHTGPSPGRVFALPQIYVAAQADQWANIALVGALTGQPIFFRGALTEVAACGSACSLAPSDAWARLWQALSANASTQPSAGGSSGPMTASTDLRIDS